MAPDIPTLSKLDFKELLSHTFPGFFFALSVFMLLDLLSPKDLTSWAFGTLTNFVSAMGFIILLGTILGILIDGIQHWIEENIFVNGDAYKKVKTKAEGIKYPNGVGHYYYYKRIGESAFKHLTDKYYRYAEFYGNIAMSLIAFSSIAPFYFGYVLEINNIECIVYGLVVPCIFAYICFNSSYTTFVEYRSNRIDMILEYYSGDINSIEITVDPKCLNITAQLKSWKLDGKEKKNSSDQEELKEINWKDTKLQKGVEITFKIEPEKGGKVESYLLFSTDTNNFENELNKNNGIPDKMMTKFKENEYPLSDNAVASGKDSEWMIKDGKEFIIRKKGGKLQVYSINHAKTDRDGKATVRLKPGKPGTATVTASSEGFIPGKAQVEVKKDHMCTHEY